MRQAEPADAPMATVLKLSARERRERGASDVPAAPARIIVFPGMSLPHLRALAASMRRAQTQTRPSPLR
jgi:hypothetical protein